MMCGGRADIIGTTLTGVEMKKSKHGWCGVELVVRQEHGDAMNRTNTGAMDNTGGMFGNAVVMSPT
jgi:hypothetical protein